MVVFRRCVEHEVIVRGGAPEEPRGAVMFNVGSITEEVVGAVVVFKDVCGATEEPEIFVVL